MLVRVFVGCSDYFLFLCVFGGQITFCMIRLIPSIAVLGGQCVRLVQGDYSKVEPYADSPLTVAEQFADHGIEEVHFIDLDGAREGRVVNLDSLELITGHTQLKVNFGGGVTTDGDCAKLYEYGVKMITVGSLALTNPKLFAGWLISYGRDRIALSADAKDRRIQIKGWQTSTDVDLMNHIEHYYNRTVQYVKCSDVSRDGSLQGPNFDIYTEIQRRFPELRVLASGGISSLDDIKRLNDLGVYGAVFGKAFYKKQITMAQIDQFLASQPT